MLRVPVIPFLFVFLSVDISLFFCLLTCFGLRVYVLFALLLQSVFSLLLTREIRYIRLVYYYNYGKCSEPPFSLTVVPKTIHVRGSSISISDDPES